MCQNKEGKFYTSEKVFQGGNRGLLHEEAAEPLKSALLSAGKDVQLFQQRTWNYDSLVLPATIHPQNW